MKVTKLWLSTKFSTCNWKDFYLYHNYFKLFQDSNSQPIFNNKIFNESVFRTSFSSADLSYLRQKSTISPESKASHLGLARLESFSVFEILNLGTKNRFGFRNIEKISRNCSIIGLYNTLV